MEPCEQLLTDIKNLLIEIKASLTADDTKSVTEKIQDVKQALVGER